MFLPNYFENNYNPYSYRLCHYLCVKMYLIKYEQLYRPNQMLVLSKNYDLVMAFSVQLQYRYKSY